MARVTVEDCLENVKNRFELVMIAAKRARQLMRGSSEPKVAWENDKPTVVALREIAAGYTTFTDRLPIIETTEVAISEEAETAIDTESGMDIDAETHRDHAEEDPHTAKNEDSSPEISATNNNADPE